MSRVRAPMNGLSPECLGNNSANMVEYSFGLPSPTPVPYATPKAQPCKPASCATVCDRARQDTGG
jgi:hypothetical protein